MTTLAAAQHSGDLSWALATLATFSLCSSLVVYWSLKFAPGFQRSALCLAVIAAYFAAPGLILDGDAYPFLIQGITCVLSVSAFKVLALSMDRGCLVPPRNFWQFHGVLALPIIPVDADAGSIAESKVTFKPSQIDVFLSKVLHGAIKLGAFATLSLVGLGAWAWRLQDQGLLAKAAVYNISGLAMLLEIDGMGDLVDAVALRVFGIQVEKHFDWPLIKSTSLSDLWARRWNLTISSVLRAAFYDPIIEGQLVAKAGGADETPAEADKKLMESKMPTFSRSSGSSSAGSSSSSSVADAASPSSNDSSCPADSASLECESDLSSSAQNSLSTPTPTGATAAKDAAAAADMAKLEAATHLATCDPAHPGAACATVPLADVTVVLAAAAATPQAAAPKGNIKDPRGLMSSDSGSSNRSDPLPRAPGPSKARKFLGTLCVFIVSGLWHELVCYYMAGRVTGYWLLFFVVQAPVLMIEQQIKKQTKKRGVVAPDWAAVLITNMAFLTMLQLMWYPPLVQTGMIDKMRAAAEHGLEAVMAALDLRVGGRPWAGAAADAGGLEAVLSSISWLLRGGQKVA